MGGFANGGQIMAPHLLDEIAHFFEVYKALEPGKGTEISDWQGREEAEVAVKDARDRYVPSSPHD